VSRPASAAVRFFLQQRYNNCRVLPALFAAIRCRFPISRATCARSGARSPGPPDGAGARSRLGGSVVAVAADHGRHFSRPRRDEIALVEGHGVEGDARAGALVRLPKCDRLPDPVRAICAPPRSWLRVAARDLGENITSAGLDLELMPLGTLIELGPNGDHRVNRPPNARVLIDRFRAGPKRHVLSSAETGSPFNCAVLSVVRFGGTVLAADTARVRLVCCLAGAVRARCTTRRSMAESKRTR
jgi:hypothetical protein